MNWDRIKPWDYVVNAVAAEYHKKFPMVELEDIKQSLYEWFVEHPNKLDDWEAIGDKDAKNLIYRSLRNQALDYCQRWKAKSLGYDVSDLHYYQPDMVEVVLPAVLRGEINLTHKVDMGGTRGTSAPSEGGNLMIMMLEIDAAYYKLSKEDRRILFLRHATSFDFKEIANFLKLGTEDAARMRHRRALRRLVDKLGGRKPYLEPDSEATIEQDEADSSTQHTDNTE